LRHGKKLEASPAWVRTHVQHVLIGRLGTKGLQGGSRLVSLALPKASVLNFPLATGYPDGAAAGPTESATQSHSTRVTSSSAFPSSTVRARSSRIKALSGNLQSLADGCVADKDLSHAGFSGGPGTRIASIKHPWREAAETLFRACG
jgi:hypothetical protein